MEQRPANLILAKMYQLAMSTEDEDTNVLNVLMRLQAMDFAMKNAFLLAKHDKMNKEVASNLILDTPKEN